MYKVAALIVSVAIAIFIISKAVEKKEGAITPKERGSAVAIDRAKPQAAQPVREVTAGKQLSEGGNEVRSFFRNWEYSRFRDMQAQTVNSRREWFFVRCMTKTPIRWQKLEILSEKQVGEDWDVQIALEVTDIVSALAGITVNAFVPPGNDSDNIYRFSPNDLGIERFMKVRQTWHVVTLGDKRFIDVGAGDSKLERHSNIMNYVLDAGEIDDAPPRGESGWNATQMAFVSAQWLSDAFHNLNRNGGDAREIILQARPLVQRGMLKLKEFAKTLEEYRRIKGIEEPSDETTTL